MPLSGRPPLHSKLECRSEVTAPWTHDGSGACRSRWAVNSVVVVSKSRLQSIVFMSINTKKHNFRTSCRHASTIHLKSAKAMSPSEPLINCCKFSFLVKVVPEGGFNVMPLIWRLTITGSIDSFRMPFICVWPSVMSAMEPFGDHGICAALEGEDFSVDPCCESF